MVVGACALVGRSLHRGLGLSRGPQFTALTVLPRPWNRPQLKGLPFFMRGKIRTVSKHTGETVSTLKSRLDPLRPFAFHWGLRRLHPPAPMAPLIPVAEEAGAQIASAANSILERMSTAGT